MEHLGAHEVFNIAGISVTNTVTLTWVLMAFLFVVSFLITRKVEIIPSGFQNFIEMIFEFLIDLIEQNIGPKGVKAFPLLGSLFLFILLGNWMGSVPFLGSPTSDLNTTVALALTVLFSIQFLGVKEKGFGFFKHFLTPNPMMLPLNIVEELSKPLSLSFRLFGNVMGEHIVVAVLLFLVPLAVPVPMMMFGLFTGALQAYVFTILSTVYLGAVYADHH
ncbi:MAG: F0F1 ATP synthase subunit A [bacterium]